MNLRGMGRIYKIALLLSLMLFGISATFYPWRGYPNQPGFLVAAYPIGTSWVARTSWLHQANLRVVNEGFFPWIVVIYTPESVKQAAQALQANGAWLVLAPSLVTACYTAPGQNRL